MMKSFATRHRALLFVLFWLFELLLCTSVVVLRFTDPRKIMPSSDAAGVTFWFAFLGLFVATFILRKTTCKLAMIGWVNLFIAFWSLALLPTL
jgi:hypothetical protein